MKRVSFSPFFSSLWIVICVGVLMFAPMQGVVASVMMPLTMRDMIGRSDVIVRGRVELIRGEQDFHQVIYPDTFSLLQFFQSIFDLHRLQMPFLSRPVYSVVDITPLEFLKGDQNVFSSLSIRQLGGYTDDVVLHIDGNATFSYNEEALFFLQREQDGYYSVVNMEQGKYRYAVVDGEPIVIAEGLAGYRKPEGEQDGAVAIFSYNEVVEYVTCQVDFVCPEGMLPPVAKSTEGRFAAFALPDEDYTYMSPPYRYKADYMPLAYFVDPRHAPLTTDETVRMVQVALERWAAVSGLSFVFAGEDSFSASVDQFTNDHKLRVSFGDPYNDISNEQKIVAIGGSYYATDAGTAGEGFHEALNGFVIFNNDSPIVANYLSKPNNFEKIVTHEFGHVLGLGHSPVSEAVMYAYGSVNDKGDAFGLHNADVEGIQSLYPAQASGAASIVDVRSHSQQQANPQAQPKLPPPTVIPSRTVKIAAEDTSRGEQTQQSMDEQPQIYPVGAFEAAWVGQRQGQDGAGTAIRIAPGGSEEVWAKFRNTGEAPWRNSGEQMVAFYIYKDPNSTPAVYNDPKSPLFGKSLFAASDWGPSSNGLVAGVRAAVLGEEVVAPGEVGTFTFRFAVPAGTDTGLYREDLTLAVGPEWIANQTNGDPLGLAHIWFPIEVRR